MKRTLLALAFLTIAFASSSASNRPTKSENDAAMKAGRKEFAAKLSQFEKIVVDNNSKAVKTATVEVLQMMRKGMSQQGHVINLETGEQQQAAAKHYNSIEMLVHKFTQLSEEPTANGKQLVDYARSFMKLY